MHGGKIEQIKREGVYVMDKLVSIITPCYNGESYVHRFLDSVLAQTYSKLELIFVNDGSTDATEKIVLSYQERFEQKGIRFVYIKQKNGGVPNAVNAGLKVFTGEYLTWPDSDDWMTPNCIEKKVKYLEAHQDVGIVACKIGVVYENHLDQIAYCLTFQHYQNLYAFERLMTMDRVFTTPIGFMVRTSMFLSVLPSRHIYDRHSDGQNWQILLPMAFRYPCAYLDELLGYYLIRSNSMSHDMHTYHKALSNQRRLQEIMEHTLDMIAMPEVQRKHYQDKIELHYAEIRLRLAAKFQDQELMNAEYFFLSRKGKVSGQTRIFYFCGKYGLYGICSKFRRLWKAVVFSVKRQRLG